MLLMPLMLAMFAAVGHAEPPTRKPTEPKPAHELAEDKARTVPGGASKGIKACHADIERFCRKIKPGEGRLGACLKTNVKKLSKRCRKWASHGGVAHIDEALARDIDGSVPVQPAAPENKTE